MNKNLVARLRKLSNQPISDCKELLSSVSEDLAARYVAKFEENPRSWFFDPMELTPEFEAAINQVELMTSIYIEEWKAKRLEELKESGLEFNGFRIAHVAAHEKQRLLREKFGIHWRTPSQMNKNVIFD